MNTMPSITIKRKQRAHYWFLPGVKKATAMKTSRMLHGYLSAFAFIALMFFSLTGLLLNHPQWLASKDSAPSENIVSLSNTEIQTIQLAESPERQLDQLLSSKIKIVGAYKSGEVLDDEIMLRYSSAKGSSTVFADLLTGQINIETKKPNVTSIIRELHRGKDTAQTWRLMIDGVAIITLLLSSIGFFLFFTIRFRLRKSMALCGSSFAIFILIYIWAIP